MSLLFNMLSRLIITFLPRSKCLLISWLQSPFAVILETNLDSIKDITLTTKVHLVKAMVFPVVMLWMWELNYEASRVPKNWSFELWCWRRLIRVSRTAKRSNQSIWKEINPECSLEGLMLKLKLQYLATCEELTHLKRPWCWGRLKLGGQRVHTGWDGWMVSVTRWTWVWVISGSLWWTGRPGVLQSMRSRRVWHDWATELNW